MADRTKITVIDPNILGGMGRAPYYKAERDGEKAYGDTEDEARANLNAKLKRRG